MWEVVKAYMYVLCMYVHMYVCMLRIDVQYS